MSDTFDENNNTVGGIPGLRNVAHIESVVDTLKKLNVFKTPTVGPAVEREQILQESAFLKGLPGLAPTDYTGQLDEAGKMAKLQLGLAMAARGFGSMGAQPRAGEMGVSTLGRELLSPLAGDAMTLGQQYYDQKLKLRTAQKGQEAAITQAALGRASQKRAAKAASEQQYRALAIELGKTNLTPVDDLERYVNEVWVPFIGFVDKTTGEYLTTDANNNLVKVPANELRKWRKPADPTKYEGVKTQEFTIDWMKRDQFGRPTGEFEPRVVQRVIGLDPRNLDVVPGQNLYKQGSDFTSPLTINIFNEEGEWEGVRRPLPDIDYVTTADGDYKLQGSGQKLYIKPKPTAAELDEITAIFGTAVQPGDEIIGYEWVNKANPRLSRFQYRNAESFEHVKLNEDQAKRLLGTEKPTLEEPGGEQVGTKVYDYTHGDTPLKAILWRKGDEIYFRELESNKRIPSNIAEAMWPSATEDADAARFGGVVKNQVKAAIGLMTGLESEQRNVLEENALKDLDNDRIKAFLALSDPTKRRNEINQWLKTILAETPTPDTIENVSVRPEVKKDVRIQALSTASDRAGGAPNPLISSRTFYPYGAEGETIQLANGNIPGLDNPIPVEESRVAQKHAQAIRDAFKSIMRTDLTPQDEDVLLFSGLWKHLPTVSGRVGQDTYRSDDWKQLFEAARSKYNAASAAIKPASEIKYGRRQKTLADTAYAEMDALRDNTILLRNYKVFGSFPIGGNIERDIRSATWLGELWEAAVDDEGDIIKGGYVPTEQWAIIAQKDEKLTEQQRELKHLAFERLKKASGNKEFSMNKFEQAAEVVSALARYRVNAFNMVQDSRPSDRDIMLILGMLPGETGDTETTAFNKIIELQRRHRKSLTRTINEFDLVKWSPEMMVYMDQLGRGFEGEATRVPAGDKKERIMTQELLNSSSAINRAANNMHQIIPGHRSGRVSPITGRIDERSVNRLYNIFLEAARGMYGVDADGMPRSDAEALEEMKWQGATIDLLSGVYDVRAGGGRDTGVTKLGPGTYRINVR